MKHALLTGLTVMWATSAFAHSPLDTTVPAHDASIAAAPAAITLGFKGDIRLTRVTVVHDMQETDLSLDGFSGFISDYNIPMPSMGTGLYQIEWRGLGDDGHAMNGTFSFTVQD